MDRVDSLLTYVNSDDRDAASEVVAVAVELVDRHIDGADVPQAIYDRAVTECAAELWHRRNAPHGIAQFATIDAPTVRVSRDPMKAAYATLAPWCAATIA